MADGNDFAISKNINAELMGEIVGDSGADFGIFLGKDTISGFQKYNFAAKFGKEGCNFATGAAGTDDGNNSRQTSDFDGGFGVKKWNSIYTGDILSVEMRAGRKDEMCGSDFFVVYGDGVSI